MAGGFGDPISYIEELIKQREYEKADQVFIDSETYKDCPEMLDKIEQLKMRGRYEHAMELMEERDFSQAYQLLQNLEGYADSQEKMLQTFQLASVGDTLPIGNNSKYYAEWRVLAKEENRMLVINERTLGYKKYDSISHGDGINWENCSVRQWLNEEFYEETFDDFEHTFILETVIEKSGGCDRQIAMLPRMVQ